MLHSETVKISLRNKENKKNESEAKSIQSDGRSSDHNNLLPVFRINPDGRIIYSNRSSHPILKSWNCYANNTIPQEILNEFPSLVNLNADETIEIKSDLQNFFCSVIGFPTGGYIGVYGYKVEIETDIRHHN